MPCCCWYFLLFPYFLQTISKIGKNCSLLGNAFNYFAAKKKKKEGKNISVSFYIVTKINFFLTKRKTNNN